MGQGLTLTRPFGTWSRSWRAAALAVTLALVTTACHDGASDAGCAEGAEGCGCAADEGCDAGLVCEAGLCIASEVPPDASVPDATVVDVLADDAAPDSAADTATDSATEPDVAPEGCDGEVRADFCACRDNADCASGFCLPSSEGGNVCTRTCSGACPDGFDCLFVTLPGLDPTYLCVEPDLNLCRPCTDDAACQRDAFGASGARCVRSSDAEGSFCGVACSDDSDCPGSYACREVEALETGGRVRQCVPADPGASCECSGRSIADAAFTRCAIEDCSGTRRCEAAGLSACTNVDGFICEPSVPVTVTFDPQSGVLAGDATRTVLLGAPYGLLPGVSREGHDAAGWWTQPAGAGDPVTADTLVTNATAHTLFAAWTPRRYVVTFDAAGGSACEPRTVTFGAAYGADGALCAPARPGFIFDSWRLEDGGAGTVVSDTTRVATARDHTLTARWVARVVTVSFDSEGGSSCASRSVTVGATYGTAGPLCAPTRSGFAFGGWYDGDDGRGALVTADTVVTVETNHVLYARWTGASVTVRFDAAGGASPTPASRTVTFGEAYGPLATTSRAGHAFDGWWTTPAGQAPGVEVTAATIVSIASDHVLHARWAVTATGVSAVRLHLPGAAISRPRSGTTWFSGSAGHGGPTGRSGNGTHWIHFGFHPGLAR
jgi:uncharacterized repeat protein (TIGR02543 family)